MDKMLTIIVPAYNVEKYIDCCLDSLVNQTDKSFHVIIVNDGSTDRTEEFCKNYIEQYPELFTYVHQNNKGLGGARNTGLKVVESQYVAFLDSDDYLDIYYVEKVKKILQKVEELPDIIFTLPIQYDSVTKFYYDWKDKPILEKVFGRDGNRIIQTNVRKNPELYSLEPNACRKIYKTNFLKNKQFSFPEHLKWEDVPGHFYLLHEANTCIALQNTGFYYRTNQGGNICSGSGETRLDIIPIFNQLKDVCENCYFTSIEKSYALKLVIDFTNWFIEETNQDCIVKLLDGLHEIYQSIDEEIISLFLHNISSNPKRDIGLIEALKSDEYLLLSDYISREYVIQKYSPVETIVQKGRIRRAMECVADHGVTYSIILIFRRIKKRLLKQYKVVNGEIIYD